MKNETLKLKTFVFFLLVFTFSFLTFNSAAAQVLPPPLSLTSLPSSPSPGEQFTVTASTPTFDKNTAFFEWTVDGKAQPELSGFGKNIITRRAGKIGGATSVSVRASRPGGETAATGLVVSTSDLAITWSAESTAPKWYRGKILASPNSMVAIVAIPRIVLAGEVLRPSELIYRWSIDNERDAESGVGNQTFRFRASQFIDTTHQIDVVIEDIERKIAKHGRVLITSVAPRVAIYPSSPLGGVEFRTANFFATAKRGLLDFIAEPFFFPVAGRSGLTWRWTVDGIAALGNETAPHLVTADAQRRGAGQVQISATADDNNILTPSVTKTFSLLLQ